MSVPRDVALRALVTKLLDEGKLIESGWVSLQQAYVSPEASASQLEQMRAAFFAGALHAHGAHVGVVCDGSGAPRKVDAQSLDGISNELELFAADFQKRHGLLGREH